MSEDFLSKLSFGVKHLLIAAGWMGVAVPLCLGQTGAATTAPSSLAVSAQYVPTMTFDVASVRENKDVNPMAGFTMSGFFVPHTATFRVMNWDIRNLVSVAYGLHGYQLVNGPKWPWPTLFVIEAKGGSEADAKVAALTGEQQWAEQQHMLQGLLEERFKLKAHWETREGDVYNLVVAKGGPKLGVAGSAALTAEEKERYGDHPAPALAQMGCNMEGCIYFAHGCTMGELVENLVGQLGGPVADKTGLTGKYDFVLKYMGGRLKEMPPDVDDKDHAPPMDRALEEQLGLKVETAKGPVKVLVIDHIEKPSEN